MIFPFGQLEIPGVAGNVAPYNVCCPCVCKHTLFILSLLKDIGLNETSFPPLEVFVTTTLEFLSFLEYHHK